MCMHYNFLCYISPSHSPVRSKWTVSPPQCQVRYYTVYSLYCLVRYYSVNPPQCLTGQILHCQPSTMSGQILHCLLSVLSGQILYCASTTVSPLPCPIFLSHISLPIPQVTKCPGNYGSGCLASQRL